MVRAESSAKRWISTKEPCVHERRIAGTVMIELGTELDLQLSTNCSNNAIQFLLDIKLVARRLRRPGFVRIRGDHLGDDGFEATAHDFVPLANGHVDGYSSHQLTASPSRSVQPWLGSKHSARFATWRPQTRRS